MSNYQLLLECYITGQMSEKQWREHLYTDEVFAAYVSRHAKRMIARAKANGN